MKCLTIKQPFADLIKSEKKIFEIRSWKTNYRGDLLICSSKTIFNSENKNLYKTGVTICIATLKDIIPFLKSHEKNAHIKFIENYYCWVLENIKVVENIKISGKLGLYDCPIEIEKKLQIQKRNSNSI